MLSPFSSALAKLDYSLQTIQTQNERLRRGLDAADDQLRQGLADACHYSAILSDLIIARRTDANEIDHEHLDRLIDELKILRRTQRRRLKLLNLAMELSAGRVHHHRAHRTNELNQLRIRAVKELRRVATNSSELVNLPGPRSSQWLHWACSLQEETDATALQALRRDFPSLEEFIAAIDERNWVSGESPNEFSSVLAEGAAEESEPDPLPVVGHRPIDVEPGNQELLARKLLAMFEKMLYRDGAQSPNGPNEKQSKTVAPDFPKSEANDRNGLVGRVEPSDRPMVQPPPRLNKERVDKAAGLEFMKVVNAWQLDDSQARRLLGISRTLFNQMRDGSRVKLEPDKLTRISLLVAISKGVNVLYGSKRGEKWVHRPNSNPLFDGSEPLKYMLKEGVEGLVKVRELVGIWSGYISPEEQ